MSEATSNDELCLPDRRLDRFHRVHFLYGIVLLASSTIFFGRAGLVLSVPILGAWAYVFVLWSRPQILATMCVAILICSLLLVLLTAKEHRFSGV